MELLNKLNLFDIKNYFKNNKFMTSNKNMYSNLFRDVLIKQGYDEYDIKALEIASDIEERLAMLSLGSSKIKLEVSPKVYKRMVRDQKFKKKMDEILDDFLSTDGELAWMTSEARAGGGEITLSIDENGNTTYTGRLYCIPGWEEDREFKRAEELKRKLYVNKNIVTNDLKKEIEDIDLFKIMHIPDVVENIDEMIVLSNIIQSNSKKRRYI